MLKTFLKKLFLFRQNHSEALLNPCKSISRKDIRKPLKNISCIIAWNGLAKFSEYFHTVCRPCKSTLRNVTASFYKSSPKFFSQSFSKETFHVILRKGFIKDFIERIFYKTVNVKYISENQQKYFTKGYKEIIEKHFLYHCLIGFSKVFTTFMTRPWNCKNTFHEILL